MRSSNRREFVAASLAAGGALCGLAPASLRAEPAAKPAGSPTDRVSLGKSGVTASFVGWGTGVKGGMRASNQTRMGQEAFTRLARHAYDQGINLFDVADLYGTHPFLRTALKGIPREKYVIQSKIWWRADGLPEQVTDAAGALDRFRKELGTDYIDSVLLHCTIDHTWMTDLRPMVEVLEQARQKGIVRSHGTSCHGIGALHISAGTPWAQIQLARINPKGAHMDGKPEEIAGLLRGMRAAGKGVIGMKIFGEGSFKTAEEREESFRWVVDQQCVDAMVIGFEKPEQIDESLAMMRRVLKG
jgi:aryl-alcohol dehydrogenase-like predicted oxidoreductase